MPTRDDEIAFEPIRQSLRREAELPASNRFVDGVMERVSGETGSHSWSLFSQALGFQEWGFAVCALFVFGFATTSYLSDEGSEISTQNLLLSEVQDELLFQTINDSDGSELSLLAYYSGEEL